MALKQPHRKAKMATSDTNMGLNCNSDREKSKYNSKMVSFSVRKTIGFEIQTRDISNPPKRSSCINLGKGGGSTVKGCKGICTQCIWSRIGYNL